MPEMARGPEVPAGGEHSPYVIVGTGEIFCFKDGCDWMASGGGEDALNSWYHHLNSDS